VVVASHFSHVVGVYNLEGVVRLGFLYRLETMDWHQSATISAQSITRAQRLQWVARILLWLVEFWPLIALVILLAFTWVVTRLWMRRHNRKPPSEPSLDPPAAHP
jgi:DUF1365 family protein